MNCHNCGAEVAIGAVSCQACGTRLQLQCPSCQHPYSPGNRFCGNCGFNLAEAPPVDSETAPPAVAPEPPPQTYQPPEFQDEPVRQGPQSLSCPRCFQINEPDSAYCWGCGAPLLYSAHSRPAGHQLAAFELGSPGGFWLRSVAYIIDTLAVVLPLVFLWLLLGQPVPENFDQILDPPPGYERLQILVMAATLIYDTALITLWATTLGKRAFGLYVVRSDGSRVGLVRALARHIVTALSANFTLGFIFLVVAFRQDRRGLHDIICDTVVIRRYRQNDRPHTDTR